MSGAEEGRGIAHPPAAGRRLVLTGLASGAALFLGPLSFGLLAGGAAAQQQQQQEARFFRIGASGLGGVHYLVAGTIAQAISNPPGSRPCDKGGGCGVPGLVAVAQTSRGSLANIEALASGQFESAFVQADIAHWAYGGTGIFEGKPKAENLRVIARLYAEQVHVVVRREAGVRSVRELQGKRVSMDERGSGTLTIARAILEAHGLNEKAVRAQYLASAKAIERMAAGTLDAMFMVAGYPAPAIAELSQTVPIDLIEIKRPEMARLVRRYPFLSADSIPVGVYAGQPNTAAVGVGALWLVGAAVPEKLVHAITATLWNESTRALLDKGHPKGKEIRLETALQGFDVPLHPGAARYYREAGVLKDGTN